MKLRLSRILAALVATLGLAAAAQAQTVIVNSLDAVESARLRAAIEASMEAASRGQRVGMVTGTVDPQPQRFSNGMVSQELDASTMMFAVARMNPAGDTEMVCVEGMKSADEALAAPAVAKRSLSPEE